MKPDKQGFTLVELLITVAVFGMLLALAAPSFSSWIRNAKVRTAAEAILNGLQLARGEAVRRNVQVRFQLTDSIGDDCVLKPTSSDQIKSNTNWVVSLDNPAGKCASAPINEGIPLADNPAPRIIQVRSAGESSSNILANSSAGNYVQFNSLGRLTPIPPATAPVAEAINVTPANLDCTNVRCLRVTVSVGGQIRLCDPAANLKSTDTQRCN